MERTIDFGDVQGAVSLTSPVLRYPANPVLTPADVNRVWRDPGLQVVTVHNAGAAIVGDETALLFRSHLRCGMSILGVARSRDGVTDWRVDPRPALVPATLKDSFGLPVSADDMVDMESGGVEDARLNPIDGTIAVTYSAYHARVRNRVRVALATTDDLRSFTRQGPCWTATCATWSSSPSASTGATSACSARTMTANATSAVTIRRSALVRPTIFVRALDGRR